MAESDDLQGNLQNYKLQLQQVDAALTTDPYNEELLKLKIDLEEVIQLTLELIRTQALDEEKLVKEYLLDEDSEITHSKASHTSHAGREKPEWKVGDKCAALWSEDGQYHPATIESIDGEEVSVTFEHNLYKGAEVTTLDCIKEAVGGQENSSKSKNLKRTILANCSRKGLELNHK